MQLIACPWCGPREEVEFHYGGQAHVAYPADPAALSDEEWARYLFFRDNPRACSPSAGCTPPAAAAGSTPSATPPPTASTASTASTSRSRLTQRDDMTDSGAVPRPPAAGSTAAPPCEFTFNGQQPDRAPGRHPGLGAARPRRAPDRHQHQAGPAPRDRRGLGRGPERAGPDRGAVPGADAAGHHGRAVRRAGRPRHPRPGPARPRSPTPPATTPCTSTPTCWWSAPARPG